MTAATRGSNPLDPIDRLSEVMFGLLMALTFTGTMSVTLGAGGAVRDVLLAALGCNIAWGLVDGVVYVLTTVADRERGAAQARAIRSAPDREARRMLSALLPGKAGTELRDDELGRLVDWMRRHPAPEATGVWRREDVRAAGLVFLLVTGATWPPILPFLFVDDLHLAMRLSNAIAVAMLFVIGWLLDRQMGDGWRLMRWVVPVCGTVLVGVTIALGG